MAKKLRMKIYTRDDGRFNLKYYWGLWDAITNIKYGLTKEELKEELSDLIDNTNWEKKSP